jgi:hypothetical protein
MSKRMAILLLVFGILLVSIAIVILFTLSAYDRRQTETWVIEFIWIGIGSLLAFLGWTRIKRPHSKAGQFVAKFDKPPMTLEEKSAFELKGLKQKELSSIAAAQKTTITSMGVYLLAVILFVLLSVEQGRSSGSEGSCECQSSLFALFPFLKKGHKS